MTSATDIDDGLGIGAKTAPSETFGAESTPTWKPLALAAPGLVAAALILLPVLGRPFTLDDTLFLRQSEHLLVDPWHATAFDYPWFEKAERMSSLMPSGPVMAYLLLPTILSGGAEWVAHATQFLLVALAVIATVTLGKRLGLAQVACACAGVLVATTPALAAMAATAMPDAAATAFGVAGIERTLAFRSERRWHQGLLAALSLCLAVLSRSHLLLALGVVLLFALGTALYYPRKWLKVPLAPVSIIPLAIGLVTLAVIATRDPAAQSGTIWDAARGFTGSGATSTNFASYCSHWFLALPLGLGWCLLHGRRLLAQRPLWFFVPTLALLLRQIEAQEWRWMALVAGLGAAVVIDVLSDAFARRDPVQTALGAWLLLPLPVVLYTHLPCKYAAACAPAVALLLVRSAWSNGFRGKLALVGVCAGLGATLSTLIIRADQNLSELGRGVARDWIEPETRLKRRVWFAGHWGFQWYAERAGGTLLATDSPPPEPGDLLVVSPGTWATMNLVEDITGKRLLRTREDEPGGRVMLAGAGFYSNFFGYLPWVYSKLPSDTVRLWQVDERPRSWPTAPQP